MAVHQLADVLAYAHFAHELATECVDDTSNGGCLPLADEVEVEHSLHGAGLQTTKGSLLDCAPIVYSLHCCVAAGWPY